jgi:hypothetical protein
MGDGTLASIASTGGVLTGDANLAQPLPQTVPVTCPILNQPREPDSDSGKQASKNSAAVGSSILHCATRVQFTQKSV